MARVTGRRPGAGEWAMELTGVKAAGGGMPEVERGDDEHGCYVGGRFGPAPGRGAAGCEPAAGARVADDSGDGAAVLPRASCGRPRALRGVPGVAGLCRRAAGALPVRGGKTHLRAMPGALLSASPAGAGAGGDALCGAADGLAASGVELVALGGWIEAAGGRRTAGQGMSRIGRHFPEEERVRLP